MIKRTATAIIILLSSCYHSKYTIDDILYSKDIRTCDGEPVMMHYEKGRVINAQFPGGEDAFDKFIDANKIPQALSDSASSPFEITVGIFIDSAGRINKDTLVINDENSKMCRGCAAEVQRLVGLMPDWEPAYTIEKGEKRFTAHKQSIYITF